MVFVQQCKSEVAVQPWFQGSCSVVFASASAAAAAADPRAAAACVAAAVGTAVAVAGASPSETTAKAEDAVGNSQKVSALWSFLLKIKF